jgi:lipopolysaccharide/colanic/teichoic acid biosynthesis glycosyltransferase
MRELITETTGDQVYDYFNRYVNVDDLKTLVVSTSNEFNILNQKGDFNAVINLTKVNNIRYVNKFFNNINKKLKDNDIFICRFETIGSRRDKHKFANIPVVSQIFFGFEFIFLRVFPKMWGLKKIYFLFTRGRNRLLSKAEVLGRLVSCGFEIINYESFDGLMYVVSKKVKEPEFNMNVSYGPLFKMQRMGKNGKIIGVYKFRTMHPYAEYLQDYVIKMSGYAESGKPANDFRLTPWGGVLRKYWLDELPQLINVLKGDMKLVGVRPVSKRYFEEIPQDLRELRLKQKPGCIPPYVSLNRKGSVEEAIKAEREYLLEKEKHPYTTDTRYFFSALFNIIFRNKRSA